MMKNGVLFLFLALLFCAGCVKQEVEYTKKWGFGFKDKVNYPKLKEYDLTLELRPGTRTFKAGYPAELTFILCNRSKKALRIPEWYKFDPNNLRLQCQIWHPGSDKPSPDRWLDLSHPVKRPIWRYPLTIQPGEQVFVSTKLDLVANLVVTPGSERRFFVKGALNLKSVDVEAPVTYITVLPGKRPEMPPKNSKKQPSAQ